MRFPRFLAVCALLVPCSVAAGDLEDLFPGVIQQAQLSSQQVGFAPTVTFTGGTDSGTFTADGGQFVVGTVDPVASVASLSSQISGQFQRFPLGSTVAAFTFEFDPELNVFNRSTQGLGPLLSERAQTTGQGKINMAFSYSRVAFSVFEGNDLDRIPIDLSGLNFTILGGSSPGASQLNFQGGGTLLDFNQDVNLGPGSQIVFGDTGGGTIGTPGGELVGFHTSGFGGGSVGVPNVQAFLDAELDVDVFAFFLNYGVTDWLDVGAVVPLLNIDASGQGTIYGLTDTAGNPIIVRTFRERDNTFGFGDVTVRGKARLLTSEFIDAALRADVTIPTGDEDDLRGFGSPAFGPTLIFSKNFGLISPHANAGLQFRTDDTDLHQFRWAGGVDIQPHELITLTGDVIGEHLINRGEDIGKDIFAVSAGLKINPWSRLVIAANVVFRLNDQGLRADYIPSGTIEYTFR
ncbi:MAG: hypothetical protein AAF430_04480 [Myxococcota bacterium]